MKLLRRLIAETQGASAVEFALVLPVFMTLVFAIINLSAVLLASAQLHNATEDAARCYSVQTTVCTSVSTTQTYATNHYKGPGIGAAFVASSAGACHHSLTSSTVTNDGHQVTSTGNYQLNAVVVSVPIALSAAACFP